MDANSKRILRKIIIITFVVFVALLVRLTFLGFVSADMSSFIMPWYHTLRTHGIHVLGTSFSNYNPPYLYILSVAAQLQIPSVVAIKSISIFFDFALAYVVFLILKSKYEDGDMPMFGFFAVLLFPTVVLNSSFWGQCDVIYTLFLLASLLSVIRKRYASAVIFYAIAFSFKLQAIFLLPLFALFFLKRFINWKSVLIFPFVFILSLIPAALLGRPIRELFLIYPTQVSYYHALSARAPNFYQLYKFISTQNPVLIGNLGLTFTIVLTIFFIYILYKKKVLNADAILAGALLFSLILPFFLPRMHERYFYPADIVSLTYALYIKKRFYLPILVGAASTMSYVPMLFGLIPDKIMLPSAATLMAIAVIITAKEVLCLPNVKSTY